jgi:hypothetical protein
MDATKAEVVTKSEEARRYQDKFRQACLKGAEVRDTEAAFRSAVETSCEKLEFHDRRNKRNQAVGSALGVGAAAVAIPTGPFALIGVGVVGAGKAVAEYRAQNKAGKHWEIGREAIENHHRARQEFIDAYLALNGARVELCRKYPPFQRLTFNQLSVTLASPWMVKNILKNTADSAALAVAMAYPEAVASLAVVLATQAGGLSVDLAVASGLTVEAAIEGVHMAIEALPVVGLLINGAKLAMAATAVGTPSPDAVRLQKIYKDSKENLKGLRDYLKECRD